MRRALWPALLAAALGACKGAETKVNPIVGPPPEPAARPYVIPPQSNFLLTVAESVADAEQDIPSYTKIYIDGNVVGQTDVGPKSQQKKWGDVVPTGNHLFRFEKWVLPMPGEWTPLLAQWQPPERFMRIETGLRTSAVLKFSDGGRRHELRVTREPLVGAP